MVVRAVLEWDEEAQAYSATCPELNFVSSFGESRDEAIANLKEAINLLLEPMLECPIKIDSQGRRHNS